MLSCEYKPGKYDIVTEAKLNKILYSSSDLTSISSEIFDKCITQHKIKATLYFPSIRIPDLGTKKIIVGKLYVNKSNKIKVYVKQWFDLNNSKKPVLNDMYNAIAYKLRFLSETDFSLVQASIFANKHYISNDLKTVFRRLGIGHLLVVSGIHFALIVLFIKNCILKLIFYSIYFIRRVRVDLVDSLLSIVIGGAYLCLINFPVSAQRAYLFIILGKVMHNLGVICSGWSVLFCSALALFLFDQEQVRTLSFYYSFTCVGAILLFYQKGKSYYLSLKLSLGIFSLSQILTGFIFSTLNPMAWLINLLLIPMFSVILAIYCIFTLLIVLLDTAYLIEFFSQQLHSLNIYFLQLLNEIDKFGVHEVKFDDHLYIYSLLFSMACLVIFQIIYKGRAFYRSLNY
ncbi:MAG TPA: ComEC/Rec2 family competence protein [Oligoflexia bacterium]|nr:ComEC/Rec2 family competence protein [Oligoflexia bacterium]